MSTFDEYFKLRNVCYSPETGYIMPKYLQRILPSDLQARIIDIGCGYGQMLQDLMKRGYTNASGVDVSRDSVDNCLQQGLCVQHISTLQHFCINSVIKYNFIVLCHVLEHLEKSEIIPTIKLIKTHLLEQGGTLVVMVPNAQSNTGSYWAYEDFTHTTLFTAGSLFYVLKAAGFSEICFIDPDGLDDAKPVMRLIKFVLLSAYKANKNFWNRVTSSYFHKPSPQIFTYELKAIAK